MLCDLSTWPARCLSRSLGKRLELQWLESSSGSAWVDDTLKVAKSVCNSRPNAALLVLSPVVHSGVNLHAIVTKRRAVEDKLLASWAHSAA